MAVLLVASAEPGVGRSVFAAALAWRLARDGKRVTLARLAGDEGAAADAAAFASIEELMAPAQPVQGGDLKDVAGDVVAEAPAGPVDALAKELDARVALVATPSSRPLDVPPDRLETRILTRVPEAQVARLRAPGVAVVGEDRILAAPSVDDIARATKAEYLHRADVPISIERVMLGTIASDAASPYFGNRERTCVVTRHDKTDVQLAALFTDMVCLVLTGGKPPSPYLLDRVSGRREEVAVLLAPGDTVETMRAIEGLYGASRFDGRGRMERAVALLDVALPVPA
jgi:BioD-like phosphotransacetylase family protein